MMLDVLADVDCWHDNIAMIAEEVGKEIPDPPSSDQIMVVEAAVVVCRTSSIFMLAVHT
jgi:hypothetical protein